MFAGSIMKGVAIMLAPLSAGLGSAVGENSATWIFNRMPASTGGAGPSDVEDFDDICRAQLAHAALLAQGVVNIVESLIFAEGTRSAWGIGVAVAEVGVARIGVWIGARRIWIGVVVVGGLNISVVYSVHVHARRVGCVVVIDRVGFVSFSNLPYKLGVEVEGVVGLHVSGRHVVILGDLV